MSPFRFHRNRIAAAFPLGAILLQLCARAEVLPLKNASFEEPRLGAEGEQTATNPPGWTIEGVGGVFANNGAFGNKMAEADGSQTAWLNGTKAGAIRQDILPALKPNTTYTATVKAGLRKDAPLASNASFLILLQAYDPADGKLIRSLGVTEIVVGRDTLSDEKLAEFTAAFTAPAKPPRGGLRVTLATGELDGDGKGDWTFDDVKVTAQPAAAKDLMAQATGAGRFSGEKKIRYNRDIRPILSDNCFACHGTDSAARKASLRLDRFSDATATRKDSKPAIVPGDPSASELIARIVTTDEDDIMPPPKSKKHITPAQINLLRQWIAEGAEYELHWAYLAPQKAEPPAVKNGGWVANDIDRFILARLDKEGLKPEAEADRRTLARRLSLDLTGLPPESAAVEKFVKDKSAKAYENYVDSLLASKHWGEHRGRYWLDAARYADTHGIHFDNYREMWSYRDWVINAFNANMPYDQFTLEQLAGDLLENPTLEQKIASGFNRCNITSNEGGLIDEEYRVLYMKDRTETAAQVFMGMTAMCATCHDHKFDPLSTKEFYSLAAMFNNSTVGSRDGNRKDPPPVVVVPTASDRERWFALANETPPAKERVDARRKDGRADFDAWLPGAKADLFANLTPTHGMVAHLPLTEPGEKVKFNAGGANREIEVSTNAAWVTGHIAEKAYSSKPDVLMKFGDIGDFDTTNSFSFGAWVKVPNKDSVGGLIARMDEKDNYRGWDLYIDRGQLVSHIVHKWPENAIRVASKARFQPNIWTHLFVTYDGSSKASGIKLYIDGKLTEADSDEKRLTGTIRTTNAPLTIAHRHGNGSALKDVGVHDVRIYNRPLNRAEVQALRGSTRAGFLVSGDKEKLDDKQRNELYESWLAQVDIRYMMEAAFLGKLEQEDRDIRARGTVAHVMEEKKQEPAAYVLFRGEYDRRRDRVLAGTPAFLPPLADELPRNRMGLAKWLLEPNHPLTARVAVNRFWQELFGNGLVKTSGDFGATGELPSHPELLDWLAVDFREHGWDVKRLFKMMVMSSTYRQSNLISPEKLKKDPENRLLARGPRFRMDAEMIRDYALASSGLLVRKIGGRSVKPYQPDGVWEAVAMPESDTRLYTRDNGEHLYRRSVYTFWKRAAPPASMDILNAPNRETCAMRRERTNTPLQALTTLNDTQFVEAARRLAERALGGGGGANRKQRINFIAQQLLARQLRDNELSVVESVYEDIYAHYKKSPADAEALIDVGESKADAKLSKAELAAYTMVVNQLMNLDEVLNK